MQVPKGDVGKLQANFWVNNLISLLNVTSSDKAQKPLICENCDSGDTAVSRCAECSVFMCDFCVKAHKRMHSFKHHQIVSLEEVKSGGPKVSVKSLYCEKHQGETLKLFCQSCDKPICRDCTIVDHKTHEYLFVADAAAKEKESVKQLLDKTKAKVPILSTGVKTVEEIEKRVKAKETAVNKDIDAFMNKNVRILEEKRASLKHEAKRISQSKIKQLQAQREGLMFTLASINNSVEFTERALKDGSDVEVLSMKKQMVSNLSKLSLSTWQRERSLEGTLQFRAHQQDIRQMVGNIASVADIYVEPEKCTVSMVGGEPGVMYDTLAGQRREFTVVLRDNYGNQKNGENVYVSVVAPGSQGPETVINVTDNNDGTYRFSFLPQEEGHYQLTVAISGYHIQGSPFKWQAIPPAKVSTPIAMSDPFLFPEFGGNFVEENVRFVPVVPSLTSLVRTEGVLSWKVKIMKLSYEQDMFSTEVQVGVTAGIGQWAIGTNGHKIKPLNQARQIGHHGLDFGFGGCQNERQQSNIRSWQAGDVFVLFLNMNTKKLIIQNLRTSETELFEGIQGPVSPYLNPDNSYDFSLEV